MKSITDRKPAINLSATERILSGIGGGILASVALKKRSIGGIAMAVLGGDLLRRGITGHSYTYDAMGIRRIPLGQGAATTSVPYRLGIRVDRSITINRPRAEVFRFWRELQNLPRFMQHLLSVTEMGGGRSHWVVKGPADRTFEWDAVIHNEIEDRLLAWRSLPGSEVDSAGSVQFRDAAGGHATRLNVELLYNPPAGSVGAAIAGLWGKRPERQIQDDLQRLKSMLEGGDLDGGDWDVVDAASDGSFPASDAPAFNM